MRKSVKTKVCLSTGLLLELLYLSSSQLAALERMGVWAPIMAQGILLGPALVLLLRVQYLLTYTEARKRAKIKETDESEISIARSALCLTGQIAVFLAAAVLFVVLPLNTAVFQTLFVVVIGCMLLFCLSAFFLSRQL